MASFLHNIWPPFKNPRLWDSVTAQKSETIEEIMFNTVLNPYWSGSLPKTTVKKAHSNGMIEQ